MHKLTNMKLDKSDREESKPSSVLADQPSYPYGLEVRLDEKALDKLGIDTLPKVNGEYVMMARVTVTSVSSNKYAGGDGMGKSEHKSVTLQITAMALDEPPADKDAAAELYEKG